MDNKGDVKSEHSQTFFMEKNKHYSQPKRKHITLGTFALPWRRRAQFSGPPLRAPSNLLKGKQNSGVRTRPRNIGGIHAYEKYPTLGLPPRGENKILNQLQFI